MADLDSPRALLVAYAAVVVLALAAAGSTSTAAFGAYNPAWDGASDLRAGADAVGAEATVTREAAAYGEASPPSAVAVVLSPEEAYSDADLERVRRFVRRGGTLVVAEDFGPHSNDLLAGVGADARVDGRLLRDERHNYRSPAMPVATNVSNGSAVAGVDRLTLNHGTAVRPNGAEVLVATSGFAYLDGNRNGDLDDEESLGTYPVVTVERVGRGRVVVVGDPSLMINAMLERPGNRAFVRALFAGHERVLLDYSHAEGLPPLALARLLVRESPPARLLVGLAAVLVVGLWARPPEAGARVRERAARGLDRLLPGRSRGPGGPDRGAEPSASDDALLSYLAAEYPHWDEERLRRLLEGRLDGSDGD